MPAPSVAFNIVNGGLGNSAPSPSSSICVIGTSSAGVAAAVTGPYASPAAVTAALGYGPGPELLCYLIASGIQPCFVKAAGTTAGTNSAVVKVGTGVTVMTVTGVPLDRYSVVVTCTTAGTVGTAPEPTFTLSLDGGLSTSGNILMPVGGVYAIPNTGISLNFTIATMVLGDTFTFTTTAPAWVGADVTAAVLALKVDTNPSHLSSLVYLVGECSATNAGLFSAGLGAFLAAKKFVRGVCESVDFGVLTEAAWMTAIQADYATYTSTLVSVAAGPTVVPSALSGVQYRRCGAGWSYIQRLGLVTIGTSAAEVDLGALPNIQTVYHDEYSVPGLNANRFVTLTSIPGLIGYYITLPNLMYSVGSDFTEMQYGRVMDQACFSTYGFFVQRLNSKVRLDRKTGFILEKDARALESGNNAALKSSLVNPGEVSDAQTIVSRNDNISSTKTLTVTVKVLPAAYIEQVSVTMTFTNPALAAA